MTGMSRATVSLVLGGRAKDVRINPRRAEEILACAKSLSYRANGAALTIRRKRSYSVGVIILERHGVQECVTSNYLPILGINDGLQSAGYVLSLVRHADMPAEPEAVSRVFREHLLDGIIILNAMPQTDAAIIKGMFSRCVWVDTTVWEPTCCIRRDETGAGQLAASTLIRNGYGNLLYVGVEDNVAPPEVGGRHYSFAHRQEGVAKAAAAKGVSLEICGTDLEYSRYARSERRILQAMRRGWGIVAYDMSRARCLAQTALAARLVPGIDFGLACCESSSESDRVWPQLARVDFDRRGMGRRAALMMRELIEKERPTTKSEVIRGKLVPGTTARHPNESS
jgi:DNA-binding LacI/PurR family transcriptional regulator